MGVLRRISITMLYIGYLSKFLSIFILSIIGCIKKIKRYEKIWFCSKILTLKQIVIDNLNNIYPFEKIISENNYTFINKNYSYLLRHSTKEDCEPNFKKCGILDTNQNIMCIPQSDICPINEIKTNLNLTSYNHYTKFYYYDYELYFSNESINDNIVINLTINDGLPKFINADNFIFDEKTFLEGESSYTDEAGDKTIDENNNDTFIFYGNRDLTTYILKKFNEKKNIDKSYKHLYGNLYSRKYIGFDNIEEINIFINTDFSYNYKKKFPNTAAIVFGYIGIGYNLLFITSICLSDKKHAFLFIMYIPFFIGYFIYFIKIFVDLQKKKINCRLLKNIKTEEYIQDFIKTFCDYNEYKNIFLLVLIIIFCFSFVLMIISCVIKYMDYKGLCNCNSFFKKKAEISEQQTQVQIQVSKPNLSYDSSKETK